MNVDTSMSMNMNIEMTELEEVFKTPATGERREKTSTSSSSSSHRNE